MGESGSGSCFRIIEDESLKTKIMDAAVGADSPYFEGLQIVRSRDFEGDSDSVAVDTAVIVVHFDVLC
jgi:hypothetical protein